ncbi:MAG: anthranilate synthase component I family protein [Thermoanaerobaculia bacterium]
MATERVLFQGSGWGLESPLLLEHPGEVLRVEAGRPEGLEPLLERLDEVAASGDGNRIGVGFLSYEAGVWLEGSRSLFRAPERTPLAWFGFFDLARARALTTGSAPPASPFSAVTSTLEPAAWAAGVGAIRAAIEQGDVYQVNLTRRMTVAGSVDPLTLARSLAAENPVPYALAIEAESFAIVSNSPELLLDFDAARGTLESRPIKGTIARGVDAPADSRAIDALLESAKDAAEHIMIVDLIRNDVGRCSRPGTVRVPRLRTLLTFRHLHHLESTITGETAAGTRLSHVLRAMLPGGSITGAPKRASLRLVHSLEPCARGPYTGAVGFVRGDGRAVFNVPIRTAILSPGLIDYHAGGGIVWDSDAALEWTESETKSREFHAVLAALDASEGTGAHGASTRTETESEIRR